ncbi:MAG TPA: D-2-hydroxyacid dehydrogenase [Roseiflexaceae bacterium]|nr:D-2-hydroxyacid dehydrogenase [Roseiflexaceae bacterium]
MGVLLLCFTPEEIGQGDVARIAALAPDMRVVLARDEAAIDALLGEVEVAAGWFPPHLLARAPRLRWLQQWGAGADWLLRHPQAAEMDFVLTNASGVHAVPISEQIIGMLLMFARGLHLAVRAQARREWWRPGRAGVFELAGKTMLLVGVGAIGERTAELASALGMRVEGVRRDPSIAAAGVAAMFGPDQLAARLPHADVVVLTVPLSRETRGLIGAAQLRAMKSTAYLVNIGRGGTVDEAALAEALHEGWIAGAALDVFAEEPLPPGSPLWELENCIITAHYAGNTPAYNERAMAIFCDNLRRYRAGEPLRNVVDKRAGY